jgi:hypothetical protein
MATEKAFEAAPGINSPWYSVGINFAVLLMLCREMAFSGIASVTKLSVRQLIALRDRFVNMVINAADSSEVQRLAIGATLRAKGHNYVSSFADTDVRQVLYVAEGREAETVALISINTAMDERILESPSRSKWMSILHSIHTLTIFCEAGGSKFP